MSKQLRGQRYLTAANQWVSDAIHNDLPYFDYKETLAWYSKFQHLCGVDQVRTPDERINNLRAQALLGCNDRFYLVTGLLHRVDMLHPWLFARCREVEMEPDGCIDLWARKVDRIDRLEPDIRNGRFLLPIAVHMSQFHAPHISAATPRKPRSQQRVLRPS